MESYIEQLEDACRLKGYTLDELVERAGVTYPSLWRWRNGTAICTEKTAKKLFAHLEELREITLEVRGAAALLSDKRYSVTATGKSQWTVVKRDTAANKAPKKWLCDDKELIWLAKTT